MGELRQNGAPSGVASGDEVHLATESQPSRREFVASLAGMASSLWIGHATIASAQEKQDPYKDGILMDGEPPALKPGGYTVVVLPDTQNYSQHYPDTYRAQTQWIVDHLRDRNIQCVLHLGDITNNNRHEEWKNARGAMNILDGHVPYFICPGNHDYGEDGRTQTRETYLNDYFPASKFRDLPTFGGFYDREPDRMENTFHRFQAGDRKYLVLALEFGPRTDVIRWSNEVLGKHPDHQVIIITHAYMYFDDTRYNWKEFGKKQSWNPHAYAIEGSTNRDISDGEEIWENLICKHSNVIMTLNGHVLGDGLGKLASETPDGRSVHQILVNFQMRPQGGDGWLRLLEFSPDGQSVQTYDYSPVRKQRNESTQNQFQLKLSSLIPKEAGKQ